MQENAKRMRRDAAVSPVVGTILMVAITVVLAATVYGFMTNVGQPPARPAGNVAMTGDGQLEPAAGGNNPQKTFVVAGGTPGLRWADVRLQLDGAGMSYVPTLRSAAAGDANAWCVLSAANACEASSAAAGPIDAGDRLVLEDPTLDGSKLLLIDPVANAIMLTQTVR